MGKTKMTKNEKILPELLVYNYIYKLQLAIMYPTTSRIALLLHRSEVKLRMSVNNKWDITGLYHSVFDLFYTLHVYSYVYGQF